MTNQGGLHLRTRPAPGAVVLEVAGELDAHTAPELYARAGELADGSANAAPPLALVLDLTRVTFLDSQGLGAIMNANVRAGQARGTGDDRGTPRPDVFSVCCQTGGWVERALRLTGLGRFVAVFPSATEALAAAGSARGEPSL